MKLAKTSRELVTKHGGVTEFHKLTGCPISTAKKYSRGETSQPKWTVMALDWAIRKGYDIRKSEPAIEREYEDGEVVQIVLEGCAAPIDAVLLFEGAYYSDVKIKCNGRVVKLKKEDIQKKEITKND